MGASEALKIERVRLKALRAQQRHEREQFMLDRLMSPGVVRVALMSAIIAYATAETRSKSNVGPVRSALAFALPGIGIPMLAAESGIKDKYALAAISAASTAYVTGQMIKGWQDVGMFPTAAGVLDKLTFWD